MMCSYVTCIWARRLGQKVAGGEDSVHGWPGLPALQAKLPILGPFRLKLYRFAWDFAAYRAGLAQAAPWLQGVPHGCASHSRQT